MKISFVLLTSDVIVAEDIEETINTLCSPATVLRATNAQEVCALIDAASPGPMVVVLHTSAKVLLEPELVDRLGASRTPTLAVHPPLDDPACGDWVFLPPPFSSPELDGALRSLLGRQHGASWPEPEPRAPR